MVSPFSPSELTDLYYLPFWSETARTLHLLGTDDMGRDTLTRLLHGARFSLLIGFLVVLVSLGSGTILGLLSGYYGGKTDKLIMRAMDILMALPSILLAIVIVSILGPGLINANPCCRYCFCSLVYKNSHRRSNRGKTKRLRYGRKNFWCK